MRISLRLSVSQDCQMATCYVIRSGDYLSPAPHSLNPNSKFYSVEIDIPHPMDPVPVTASVVEVTP